MFVFWTRHQQTWKYEWSTNCEAFYPVSSMLAVTRHGAALNWKLAFLFLWKQRQCLFWKLSVWTLAHQTPDTWGAVHKQCALFWVILKQGVEKCNLNTIIFFFLSYHFYLCTLYLGYYTSEWRLCTSPYYCSSVNAVKFWVKGNWFDWK